MAGFVYIMSNPAFPNLLKIGKSKKDPTTDRVNELNQTGVPEPFKVEYYAFVEDEDYLERVVHQKFASKRPNKNREFFSLDCVEAIDAIRQLSEVKAKIKYEEVYYVTPEEIERFRVEQEKEAKRRAEEENRRFQAEAEAARKAAKAKAELEEAERNLKSAEKKRLEEAAQQKIRAEVAKILKKRKIATWVFWLSAIVIFPLATASVTTSGLSAVFVSLALTFLISGFLWLVILPNKSPYDIDPNWQNNKPIKWYEKYLNNRFGDFLFNNKVGNFILRCTPFGIFYGLIFLSAEPQPGDLNRFWLWFWCTIFFPALAQIALLFKRD